MVDYKLVDTVLCVSHFEQTGENILEKIANILSEFELDIYEFIFVTDRGANIVSGLSDLTRLSCSAHILNNVLSGASKNSKEIL